MLVPVASWTWTRWTCARGAWGRPTPERRRAGYVARSVCPCACPVTRRQWRGGQSQCGVCESVRGVRMCLCACAWACACTRASVVARLDLASGGL